MKKIPIDPAVQFVWALANAESCFSGEAAIRPIHFFLAFLNIFDDAFQQDAEQMDIPQEGIRVLLDFAALGREGLGANDDTITHARRSIKRQLRGGASVETQVMQMLHRTESARNLFIQAARQAEHVGSACLDLHALWHELLRELPQEAAGYFPDHRGKVVQKEVLPRIHSQETGWQCLEPSIREALTSKTPQIDQLTRDLTALARQDRLPHVVGREKEIKTVARFLLRTVKRGVILIGEAGVGKTAIVEGLAQRAVSFNAPDFLKSFRFVQLMLGDLIAGTKYRGDLEKRLMALIAEAEADPNLVLFIDEIHRVMPYGGGSEIADLLKPALARDRLRCIGATTIHEFEQHIRADTAFMRRFQLVPLAEPTRDETLSIATVWAERIEHVQSVSFKAEAIEAAVSLSGQWMRNRAWPDSAIDLLENSATFALVSSLSHKAHSLKKARPEISPALMEKVLEEVWGISIHPKKTLQIHAIETQLNEVIIGQKTAIAEMIETLSGLNEPTGQGACLTMLFVGASGIGKTSAAVCLSEALFGKNAKAFLHLQMSELKERHELARLTGAPPGFIGHAQEPLLFQFARAHPKGLILLDELDKAHPEIHDYFLQVFDQGTARDSHGHEVDFRQMIFIATCTILVDEKERRMGFITPQASNPTQSMWQQRKSLQGVFRPEFLARFHRIILFQSLTEEHFNRVCSQQFETFSRGIRSKAGISLSMDEETRRAITRHCMEGDEGVRGFLRRLKQVLFISINHNLMHAEKSGMMKVLFQDGQAVLSHES